MMLFSAKESGKGYVTLKGRKISHRKMSRTSVLVSRVTRHTEAVGHRKDFDLRPS